MIFLLCLFLSRVAPGATLKFIVMAAAGLLIATLIALSLFLAFHKRSHWAFRTLFGLWAGILALQLFCVCTFLEPAPKVAILEPIASFEDANDSLCLFYMPKNQAVLVNTLPVSPDSGRGTVSFSDISSIASTISLPQPDDQYAYLFVKNCDSISVTRSVWDPNNQWELSMSGFHRTYNISLLRMNETKDNTVYVFRLEQANVSMTEYACHYFNYLGFWIETQ